MPPSVRPPDVLSFLCTFVCPTDVMRRTALPLLLLPLVAASLAGCNYDPETRLFRQVAPKPDDVVLSPPGASTDGRGGATSGNALTQALEVCEDDSLRCHAQNIATALNTVTVGLLTLVDNVVQLPPTTREPGRRVWGPHFAVEHGATFRFEMTRGDDGLYAWCVHAGAGDLTGADGMDEIDCASDDAGNGMLRALSGFLAPGAVEGEAARSGNGEMVLEGRALREVDAEAEQVGAVTFLYDNTSGRDVTILFDEAPDGGGGRLFGTAVTYDYTSEPDGSGAFYFAARANVVGGGGTFGFDPELEDLVIRSRWRADGAGRADGTISGGDLAADESYDAIQCWDTNLTTTYLENTYEGTTTGVMESDCVFQEPLPPPDDA